MQLKDSILQEIVTKTAKLLCEYEQYVDEDGYLYDDEGNKEYVGKGVAPGTYGLHNSPLRGRGASQGGRYSNSRRKTSRAPVKPPIKVTEGELRNFVRSYLLRATKAD